MTKPTVPEGQLALPIVPTPQIPALAGHIRSGWREDAACDTFTGDGFYPDDDTPTEAVEASRAVCNDCPVRTSCRAYALLHDEEHGIWGGLTETERADLRSDLSLGSVSVDVALIRHYPNHRAPWKNPRPTGQAA